MRCDREGSASGNEKILCERCRASGGTVHQRSRQQLKTSKRRVKKTSSELPTGPAGEDARVTTPAAKVSTSPAATQAVSVEATDEVEDEVSNLTSCLIEEASRGQSEAPPGKGTGLATSDTRRRNTAMVKLTTMPQFSQLFRRHTIVGTPRQNLRRDSSNRHQNSRSSRRTVLSSEKLQSGRRRTHRSRQSRSRTQLRILWTHSFSR